MRHPITGRDSPLSFQQTPAQMRAQLFAAVCGLLFVDTIAAGVPFWGARESMSADTSVGDLKRGQFIWYANAVPGGPMLMVVSLNEQRAYIYRNGVLIGATTVSTGRKGHETPTGVFTILQKDQDHHSTIYDNAPMPYMQRLTWGGVALHAGGLPGYPESHGCVHLPSEFARLLFAMSTMGMTVVIAAEAEAPSRVTHPGLVTPVDAKGRELPLRPLQTTESLRWQPELSPTGPVSIVLSRGSGRVIVYRAGIEIGRARAIFKGAEPIGTHVLTLVAGPGSSAQRFVPKPDQEHWIRVGLAGHEDEKGSEPEPVAADRIDLPAEFVRRVFDVLALGTTVLVTDEPITPQTTGPSLDVINADAPES